MENLVNVLHSVFYTIKKILETAGVTIITVGVLLALFDYIKDYTLKILSPHLRYSKFRFTLGKATISGLEVMVAADVISTVTDLDYYKLGVIAVLVAIRTILNYTLMKDLEAITPEERKAIEESN